MHLIVHICIAGTGMHVSGMVPHTTGAPPPNPAQLNHGQPSQFVPQQGHQAGLHSGLHAGLQQGIQPGVQPGGLPPPANQLPLDPMFNFLTEPLAEGLTPIQVQFIKRQCHKN